MRFVTDDSGWIHVSCTWRYSDSEWGVHACRWSRQWLFNILSNPCAMLHGVFSSARLVR